MRTYGFHATRQQAEITIAPVNDRHLGFLTSGFRLQRMAFIAFLDSENMGVAVRQFRFGVKQLIFPTIL